MGLLSEEQWRFRPCRFIVDDIIPAVRTLQELDERTARVPVFLSFVDMQKAYDFVDSTVLWQVFACLEMSLHMMANEAIYMIMEACMRFDGGTCLEGFKFA